jgi:hypothetical protein
MILGVLLILGGYHLQRGTKRGLVLAGAIAALIPTTACCCLALPIGVWALIVLSKGRGEVELHELRRGGARLSRRSWPARAATRRARSREGRPDPRAPRATSRRAGAWLSFTRQMTR